MTIDDADLLDLAIWVAWKKRMVGFRIDDYGIRIKRGTRTGFVMFLAALLGFNIAGPWGALILGTCAAMYAIEVIFNASEDEGVSISEFLLFSDEFGEGQKKKLTDAVRNAIVQYESAEFAVLSEMVGAYEALQEKVARTIYQFLKEYLCFHVMTFPEGR
ncbi:unnamed protein product [Notodromas monacha]|uniref:Uncharacterized protein n=1 Tax=Notodromas monacha TaxID=399045 RepID=A0A7R9BLZ1_9CRUS|nr:unnamed protein product [Notodromas monacha]CAG0917066.1 unnamed protein product [Notodromas monacha]